MMDCCLSDGILIHGGLSGLGSSSEVDMLPDIAQGRQNTPVSIGSTVKAPSVSLVATVKASDYPGEASVSSLAVVCVPSEVVPTKAVRILASEKGLLCQGFLGSKNASHPLPAMKGASSSVKGSKAVVEESLVRLNWVCSSSHVGGCCPNLLCYLQVSNRACPESEREDR
jgi:hypothetical protein